MMTKPAARADAKVWRQAIAIGIEANLAAGFAPGPGLQDAVRYALLGGGKRLRPLMLIAATKDAPPPPPDESPAWDLAIALECLHCYSLIHDDLPCMDNANERRGKPSCHKAHGEAMALLAGDYLQAMAFDLAAKSNLPQATTFLSQAACAIVGGQAIDIGDNAGDEESFVAMYKDKTGALFVCAARMGLLCRNDDDAKRLDTFAAHFGVAFQIANDIGGEDDDRAIGKKTIVTELGKPRAIAIAKQYKNLAADELKKHPSPLLADLLGIVQL